MCDHCFSSTKVINASLSRGPVYKRKTPSLTLKTQFQLRICLLKTAVRLLVNGRQGGDKKAARKAGIRGHVDFGDVDI